MPILAQWQSHLTDGWLLSGEHVCVVRGALLALSGEHVVIGEMANFSKRPAWLFQILAATAEISTTQKEGHGGRRQRLGTTQEGERGS